MNKVPCHLAIIMDGNRRWAKEKAIALYGGHQEGVKKVKEVLRWCRDREIKILTLYAFSAENWDRNKEEVNFLMNLFQSAISDEIHELHQKGIKFKVIGQKSRLPAKLQKLVEDAEAFTKDNQQGFLNLAISYSGWEEMAEAIRKIIEEKIPPEKINQALIRKYLWSADIPDADLIIRTSGEQRISDFLTWEASYAELYFCSKHWPDFSEENLDEALRDYQKRQRRFGR
ncbi:MAG: polyprenyl diphosphate synthase [bacterium]|nr:polyprenyl diphosphate synthase [bacterium]